MKYSYQFGNETLSVELEKTANGFRARLNGEEREIQVLRVADGELTLMIAGKPQTIYFALDGAKRFVAVNGKTYALSVANNTRARGDRAHAPGDDDAIRSPMPGQVRVLSVTQGENVEKGQTLLVIEAMKMEIRIPAPRGGQVKVLVQVGESVEREQVLAEIM